MNVCARATSIFLLGPVLMAAACITAGDDSDEQNTASAELPIAVVPTGVQCVKVVVNVGAQVINPPLMPVTAGSSSASLGLGLLPAGNATFTGTAYNVACASVTTSTVANWIADPAAATLSPGTVTAVMLTFRQNNAVTVGAGFVPNIAEVTVGAFATYARLVDGTVLQWGGVDINAHLLTPAPAPMLANVVQVTGGFLSACARKVDHSVVCWGTNLFGQLGPNIPVGATNGFPVALPQAIGAAPFVSITLGQTHGCALQGNGVACWGGNSNGQFGNGTTTPSLTPIGAFGTMGAVDAGFSHTCAIDETGSIWCAGNNASGQIGNGTVANNVLSFTTPALANVVSIAPGGEHTCALMGDGTVRCWGSNVYGQLGDGTFTARSAPVAVVGLTNVVQLQAGFRHTCALLDTGTVSCWGQAAMLGAGVITDRNTPVSVPLLTNVTAIHTASTAQHTCVESADHSIKCWGNNANGQIGNGTMVFANRPTAVVF